VHVFIDGLTFIWACFPSSTLIDPVTQPPVAESGSKYQNNDEEKQQEANNIPAIQYPNFYSSHIFTFKTIFLMVNENCISYMTICVLLALQIN